MSVVFLSLLLVGVLAAVQPWHVVAALPSPAGADYLLGVNELARRLDISVRKVRKMLAGDELPAPVRLGRAVRWRASDISLFIELGLPTREEFEAARAARCSR